MERDARSLAGHVGQVDGHRIQRRLPGHVEKILGESPEALDLSERVAEGGLVGARECRAAAGPNELHRSADHAERIADLVRGHGRHARQKVPSRGSLGCLQAVRLDARPAKGDGSERQGGEERERDAREQRAAQGSPGGDEGLPGLERKDGGDLPSGARTGK